ncbi:DUF2891 domain-containing protein [Pontixanthobacter aquaemixtae]|uniref:DUF2891 family protein n=1 Tax=Pontixanthobacter aquaemixtae TaxID=1958940 RepID=A0A844ZQK6_9SPHN|nr:DUF2891 domain-containing protein [Pontixanthobacter aquaemixtae]MXO89360.1 DUF2891 family protein [Pontixanthobacter aquaemixtae]
MELTRDIARNFARIALGHVAQEYPHKLDHVMSDDADVLPPRVLHPCFFGSFDWHSCVHGWWTLLTLRRLYPDMPEAAQIAELAESTFTEEKLAAELRYLDRPGSAGFERPYGWGWLLYLHLEAVRHADQPWGERLEPLARAFAARFKHYLSILTYPIRTGTHFNSAFALTLAMEWADAFDANLAGTMREAAKRWFGEDRGCKAWEPGGDEFLSPALSVAMLMQKSLPPEEFANWFDAFLPDLADSRPATLFTPATVSDRSDGKVAHLDGLNLSRAWAWREVGQATPEHSQLAERLAHTHLDAAMPHVAGDYAGEHWLASFALLALLAPQSLGLHSHQ